MWEVVKLAHSHFLGLPLPESSPRGCWPQSLLWVLPGRAVLSLRQQGGLSVGAGQTSWGSIQPGPTEDPRGQLCLSPPPAPFQSSPGTSLAATDHSDNTKVLTPPPPPPRHRMPGFLLRLPVSAQLLVPQPLGVKPCWIPARCLLYHWPLAPGSI